MYNIRIISYSCSRGYYASEASGLHLVRSWPRPGGSPGPETKLALQNFALKRSGPKKKKKKKKKKKVPTNNDDICDVTSGGSSDWWKSTSWSVLLYSQGITSLLDRITSVAMVIFDTPPDE